MRLFAREAYELAEILKKAGAVKSERLEMDIDNWVEDYANKIADMVIAKLECRLR